MAIRTRVVSLRCAQLDFRSPLDFHPRRTRCTLEYMGNIAYIVDKYLGPFLSHLCKLWLLPTAHVMPDDSQFTYTRRVHFPYPSLIFPTPFFHTVTRRFFRGRGCGAHFQPNGTLFSFDLAASGFVFVYVFRSHGRRRINDARGGKTPFLSSVFELENLSLSLSLSL